MRTYGRINGKWVTVTTDPNGQNDHVYLTTLAQVLLLNLGESPFYANFGIPAHQAVIQRVFPDYYVAYTQQQFSQYFASLLISRRNQPEPVYDISVTTHQGVKLNPTVAIPT